MLPFSKIYKEDVDVVGKKAVELAEISRLEIPIPDGFVISINFFRKFLEQIDVSKLKDLQELSHPSLSESIDKLFEPIKREIMHTHIPESLVSQLHAYYKKHAGLKDHSLNVFSSSPRNNKSMLFENLKGDANLILKTKEIWASHINDPVAIIVQKNIAPKTKNTTISNNPIKGLENIARKIQKHFYFPQEIDYVVQKGKIYVIAIRPFTGKGESIQKSNLHNGKVKRVLARGISVNPGIVTGRVKILNNKSSQIKNGEIIVLHSLNKSLFEEIKNSKGVIADGILPSAFDRNFYKRNVSIPTIVGTVNATKILRNGNVVTVNGASGEIYSGGLI